MDLNDLHLPPERLRDLTRLLEKAHRDYETGLENLTDAATGQIEDLLDRDPQDIKELVREYVLDASQLTHDYYDTVRGLWEQSAGIDFPDFEHGDLVDTDRALWKVRGGFNNTGSPGLTFTQVKNDRSRAGYTMDDLWPAMGNVDDAQQFIADIIMAGARLTMQSDILKDPTRPRWARVPKGSDPCAFCVMLAGRGFAYRSEETASFGGTFHNGHCHCLVVPSWGGNKALTRAQRRWRDMYQAGKAQAGGTSPQDVAKAMRELYPEDLRDGRYTLSAPWPDEVIRPSAQVWRHILDNHAPNATVPGKTHFPDSWSQKMIKHAVMESVADPDLTRTTKDGLRENRYRMVYDQLIRVWLQKRRSTHGRFMINTAHMTTDQEREALWQRTSRPRPHTGG